MESYVYNNNWEKVEGRNAYIGDLKDPNGRRIIMIVTEGVAVFARSVLEDYFIMKDDFLKIMDELEFVLAAKVENGMPNFTREIEIMFHPELIEEITSYLMKSLD